MAKPAGLEAIYNCCKRVYPNQPKPLQVSAVQKIWMGGPDPLDYVAMYSNPGDAKAQVPPHWHYISFGLSDLYGDGRVHEFSGGEQNCSGFGFELTFRLRRDSEEDDPPTWPAALMQALARYVFQTDTSFVCGDHIPWRSSLDGSASRIRHMIIGADPQIPPLTTPHGTVNFVQIFGVTEEELQAAQQWNGLGVVEMLKNLPSAGGDFLVTDMRRGESLFDIGHTFIEKMRLAVEEEGSNLSGVTSRCEWFKTNRKQLQSQVSDLLLREGVEFSVLAQCTESIEDWEAEKCAKGSAILRLRGHVEDKDRMICCKTSALISSCSSDQVVLPESGETHSDVLPEMIPTNYPDAVAVTLDKEAAVLLPLALRYRLRHGRHFTFKSALGDTALTLVTPSITGSYADEENIFAFKGLWLHVLLDDDILDRLEKDLDCLNDADLPLPVTFMWPARGLSLTVYDDEDAELGEES